MKRYAKDLAYGSHEAESSLDKNTLELFPLHVKNCILNETHCCAGFSIFNSLPPQELNFSRVIDEVVGSDKIERFSEQTIFNEIIAEVGSVIPCNDVSKLSTHFNNKLKKESIAIHYPGKQKFQFWIDSL